MTALNQDQIDALNRVLAATSTPPTWQEIEDRVFQLELDWIRELIKRALQALVCPSQVPDPCPVIAPPANPPG